MSAMAPAEAVRPTEASDGTVCPVVEATGRHRRHQHRQQLQRLAIQLRSVASARHRHLEFPRFSSAEDNHPAAQIDTSTTTGTTATLGANPEGVALPNGMDFWWDGQGVESWRRGGPSAGRAEPMVAPAAAPRTNQPASAPPLPGRTWQGPQIVCSTTTWPASAYPPTATGTAPAVSPGSVKYALGEGGPARTGSADDVVATARRLATGLPRSRRLTGRPRRRRLRHHQRNHLPSRGRPRLVGVGWPAVAIATRRRGRRGLGWLSSGWPSSPCSVPSIAACSCCRSSPCHPRSSASRSRRTGSPAALVATIHGRTCSPSPPAPAWTGDRGDQKAPATR